MWHILELVESPQMKSVSKCFILSVHVSVGSLTVCSHASVVLVTITTA